VFFGSSHPRGELLAAAAFLVPSCSGASEGIGCITQMTMPRFLPTLMEFAPASGRIYLTIGDQGKVLQERFEGGNIRVHDQLQLQFRELTSCSPACDGKTISFQMTWLIEGDVRVVEQVATVRFLTPDQFIVRFSPMLPRKTARRPKATP
jgi:hypothetical protein